MANNFNKLKAALSPESQAKAAQNTVHMLQEMALHKLREARGLSQKMMAETLHIQQPAVAKIEKRTGEIAKYGDEFLQTLKDN